MSCLLGGQSYFMALEELLDLHPFLLWFVQPGLSLGGVEGVLWRGVGVLLDEKYKECSLVEMVQEFLDRPGIRSIFFFHSIVFCLDVVDRECFLGSLGSEAHFLVLRDSDLDLSRPDLLLGGEAKGDLHLGGVLGEGP